MTVELAMDLFQAVSVEVVLFIVTATVAAVLRSTNDKRRLAWKVKQAPSCGEEAVAVKVAVSDTEPVRRKRSPERVAGIKGGSAADERPAIDWSRLEWLVDQICEPGSRGTQGVLEHYAEFRAKLDRVSIAQLFKSSKHASTALYTSVVQCAVRCSRPELVDRVVADMIKSGVPRSRMFYEQTMKMLAAQKHFSEALSILDRLEADNLQPSAVTWSCAINFALKVGELDRAVAFFSKLKAVEKPSIRACMTVLRVHADRKDWASSASTLRDMLNMGVPLDSIAFNVVFATGVATGNLEQLEELFAEVENFQGVGLIDVVSYNTLIKGYAVRCELDKALAVMNRMRTQGVLPNLITFNTAMDAATRSGKSSSAWDLLKVMREEGLGPDKFTCSILLKGLGEQAPPERLRDSLELLQEVGPTAIDPNMRASLFSCILEPAMNSGDGELLKDVVSCLRRQGMTPSATVCRRLSALTLSAARTC